MKTRSQPLEPSTTRTRKKPVVIIYQRPSSTRAKDKQVNQVTWDPTQLESDIQDRHLSTQRWVDETRSYEFDIIPSTELNEPHQELSESQELIEPKQTQVSGEIEQVKRSKEPKELKQSNQLPQPKQIPEPKTRKQLKQPTQPAQRQQTTQRKPPTQRKQPEEPKEIETKSNHSVASVIEGAQSIGEPVPRSESTLEYLQLPPVVTSSQATPRADQSLHDRLSPDRNGSKGSKSHDTPTNKRILDRPANSLSEPSTEPKKARKTSYPGRSQPAPIRLSVYDEQDPFGFVQAERARTEALSPPVDRAPSQEPASRPSSHPPPQDHSDNLNHSDLSLADLLNLRKKPANKQANKKMVSKNDSAAAAPSIRSSTHPPPRQQKRSQKPHQLGPEKLGPSSLNKVLNDENFLGDHELLPSSPSSSTLDPTGELNGGGSDHEQRNLTATNPTSRPHTRRKSPSIRKLLKPKENIPSRNRSANNTNIGRQKTVENKNQKMRGKKGRRSVGVDEGQDPKGPKAVNALDTALSVVDEDDSRARRLSYYRELDQLQFEEEVVIDL